MERRSRMGSEMLGRHIYRVSPRERGRWSVEKEGEAAERGRWQSREEAMRQAYDLAARDMPSKVVVEAGGGILADERLFGDDTALELERALGGETKPPPMGEKPGR
jgi:uncharacterized protein DUF2188